MQMRGQLGDFVAETLEIGLLSHPHPRLTVRHSHSTVSCVLCDAGI
jgi:hypothetical protein